MPLTDEAICRQFTDAADFVRRELHCDGHTLYAYAIDGLVAAGSASAAGSAVTCTTGSSCLA